MSASYVARQAIYDRHLRTVGYELLFRSTSTATEAGDIDPDAASASALVTALADVGLDALVGHAPAFVNAGRGFVVDGQIRVCPPGRVVLEVLEEVATEPEVLAALRGLVADGYEIALDGFVFRPQAAPLVELANFVKIEVDGRPQEDLARQLDALRRFRHVKALAKNVETSDEFERCMLLGFSRFQGYYFSRPQLREGRVIDPGRLSRLQLLANLRDENIDPRRLEMLIARDLGLSHRVLLFVNSAYVGLPRRMSSIRQAIMMIGFRNLRLFADIVVLADSNDRPNDRPNELLVTALVRARMCEQLAHQTGVDPDTAFTVGLFSAADALLDVPMEEVLVRLPFSGETKAALAAREGPLGALLHAALTYEDGTLDPGDTGLSVEQCEKAYLDAVSWSADVSRPPARTRAAAAG